MAAAAGPNLGLVSGWSPGDGAWGPPMNDNLKKLDALVHLTVLSATALTPAVATAGARYIVPATGATGAFVGQANNLAVRVDGAWVFYVPVTGWTASVQSDGSAVRWSGTAWVDALAAQPYLDISNSRGWTLPNGTTWTTIQLFTKNADTANGWGASTYKYTVPVSGVYLVEALLRPTRTGATPLPVDVTLALGFGTASADSVDVVAGSSPDLNEMTVVFSKPMRLTAGQLVYLFGKHSGAAAVSFTYAQLKLVRISA